MSDELFEREEFISYFRDEAEELLQQIDADLLRLEEFVASGESDPEIVNSLFRALHTIKGSSGMLGLAGVQGLAHKLENLCDLLRKDRMPLSESVVDNLFAGRDILTELVRASIDDRDLPDGVDDYVRGLDLLTGIYEETAHVIESTALAARESQEKIDGNDARDNAAFEEEVARMLAAASCNTSDTEPSPEPAIGKPVPVAAPATPKAARKAGSAHQTIRVDIGRLDALLNLVGELVINRTRISDIANTLDRLMQDKVKAAGASSAIVSPLAKDLTESAALLARTTNEIQESIMKVRMVPIGQVFDRFPRLVRDVAKARGKEVILEISGAETDLDKTIVDEVGEPLMHLLRNNVDHGIEPPDERERRGKNRAGTIKLNAYHEGNQIIIEVSDDGAGINLEKVRARAVKQNLITAEDRLSDREIVELIFTPGFSTADVVSDVSGRGVGMDVVKRNITRLKGAFDVDTVTGQGTRFTIKLPLTLAIIQALLVRVADELYAIPLDSVIESQRIEMPDVRTVHGNEVITLRGQVVPLVRIAEFFELSGERDPAKVMIVIVGLQGKQVGLVVDSFEGEQEIVIKPLSDVIGRIAGISGATILGNGSISLIIDVHSLVSEAYQSGRSARAEFSGV
ncbi:MAG: chemotaxis protein CheA [Candidatus Eremiobacteraeota bacterium]|nr:chemotaxis protein CheA [Candidatus Eremiobacteraeota bacterium]